MFKSITSVLSPVGRLETHLVFIRIAEWLACFIARVIPSFLWGTFYEPSLSVVVPSLVSDDVISNSNFGLGYFLTLKLHRSQMVMGR